MSQILIDNVTKTYAANGGTAHAVRNASLAVEQGDFISIVGHSGSGKTTLLSLIGGIVRPSSGNVLYQGVDISTLASDGLAGYRCDAVGYMFQFASLLPVLTVRENLLLPALFSPSGGMKGNAAAQKAETLIHRVGLGGKLDAYPSQLSGGQQRRVAIARAFMNGPAVVLADEPTGDLDEETEWDMMDFFLAMNREERTTFLMVTHNSELAGQARRRFRMHAGVIEEQK